MRLVQLFGPHPDRLQPLGIRYGDVVYAADISASTMNEALRTLCAVLDEAGVSRDGLARVTAFVRTTADREPIYGPWDALFPDPANRPAFKVLLAPLPAGSNVRLDGLALANGTRQRVDLPGVPARDPTVKVGDWIMTSRVHGTDPATGNVAVGGLDVEARQAFANIAALTSSAPLTQLTGFVRDEAGAAALASAGGASGSELTTLTTFVPPTMQLMLEAIAGTPAIQEVFAAAPQSPIPDAIVIDNLFFAPALTGARGGDDFTAQLRTALKKMLTTLERASLGLADVGHVTVFLPHIDLKPALNDVWTEWFPNSADRPPHKYVPLDLPPDEQVRLQVFAIENGGRRVLEIPGLVHGDPMSMGACLADVLFSSRIVGTDTASGATPTDPESQARIAFDNVRSLLSQAGATPLDLNQILAFIITDRDRAAVEAAYNMLYPHPDSGPPLRFLRAALPGSTTVRLEVLASVPRGTA
ncbi:MAG TPA: Rid family hydrolase [Chloroflexota bacterium]|nr:Rid family hydrolase [Chloroflexota bacterium]